ncbi:MAG: DNA repair protein RecO [Clostridiales bacterium]|nr:DNA repair protein RecO [Clostridiales bacterium]
MYFETEGIVLKKRKLNDSDVFLTLLTKKLGKVQVFVKGANNPKNSLNKGSHPFVYADFSIRGEKNYSLSNVETKDTFYNFRENLKTLSYASYFVDIVDHVINEDESNFELFQLLIESLMILNKTTGYEEKLKLYFEFKALKALGYAPLVNQCMICSKKENFNKFSVTSGGVICKECSKKHPSAIDLHPMVIKLMQFTLSSNISEYLKKDINSLLIDKMDIFINSYMEYYLQMGNIKSKKFLKIYE